MALPNQYAGDGSTKLDEGDVYWRGVNMRLHPAQLPAGYAARAVNLRFRNGVPETRLGFVKLGWTNKTSGTVIQPYGTVHGAGTFQDPVSGREYVLIAADGNVYITSANNAPTTLPLPSGVTITGDVQFVQAFDVVLMFRGFDLAPLVMTSVGTGFAAIDESGIEGVLTIPNSNFAINALNRLFVIHEGDYVAVSDIQDYTRYTIYDDFRINQGGDDALVALSFFGRSALVCLKGKSVYQVGNLTSGLDNATLSPVTRRFGCVAAKSVVDCGTDLLWLSQFGVASLTLTAQNELQVGSTNRAPMFSDAIQPLIDRINWNFAGGAVGKFWDNKYYLAVPLDDAETFRDELVPVGMAYLNPIIIPVTAGATYRYEPGSGELGYTLVNGASNYTRATDFVAVGATVTLQQSASDPVDASLRQVFKGVNNAVLVFDFLNGAWSGHDEAMGLEVAEFFTATYNGRDRLFFISPDGWVNLYEEDFEDQLSIPYAELLLNTIAPTDADSFSVNGGTAIGVRTDINHNTPTKLGADTLARAQGGLWTDFTQDDGYYPGSATVWTAPNTAPLKVSNGVRFYSTNGVAPTLVVTNSSGAWTANTMTTQQITSTLVTRAYTTPPAAFARKRVTEIDVVLQTWHPSLSISLIPDGVEEERSVRADWTRSRTAYERPFNRTAWDPTNVNDDFAEPYRGDYSVSLGGNDTMVLGSGVQLNVHQEAQLRVATLAHGRSFQMKFVNTQGRFRLIAGRLLVRVTNDKKKGAFV